jgi:hypothetical protein
MFAFFPYLKTSAPVRYRNLVLRSTADSAGLSADAVEQLHLLRSMFFLRDHQRIAQPSYAFCADGTTDGMVKEFRQSLAELRELLGYVYSSPHPNSAEPFLRREHSTLYLFTAKPIFLSLVANEEGVESALPAEYPAADGRHEVPGFECEVDQSAVTWVTRGSRLYPPCTRLWLNVSQDLHWDLEGAHNSPRYGPILKCFQLHREPADFRARLLTALTWFNRSIGLDVPDDVALVHLATAFESLLGLEQGPDTTKRFKETVLLLIGNVPRADAWAEQFYRARSETVHRGLPDTLRFNPYKTAKNAPEDAVLGYRSLTSYGWFVFQICAAAVSGGALVAGDVGLEPLLMTNRQRVERICRTLSSDRPADERLRAVAKDASDISEQHFVPEPGLATDQLLGMVRRLTSCYLEILPTDQDLVARLKAVAGTPAHDTFTALDHVRVLGDWLHSHASQELVLDDPRQVVASLVDSVWNYTFPVYFHLERQARDAT